MSEEMLEYYIEKALESKDTVVNEKYEYITLTFKRYENISDEEYDYLMSICKKILESKKLS